MNELLLAALTIAILMVATWLISVAIKDGLVDRRRLEIKSRHTVMAHDVAVGSPPVPLSRSTKSWAWRGLPLCRNEETLGLGVSPHQFLDGLHASRDVDVGRVASYPVIASCRGLNRGACGNRCSAVGRRPVLRSDR